MSVSKKHLADRRLRKSVVYHYRTSLLTTTQIAKEMYLTVATVLQILREDIQPDELRRLKAIKYSASKMGDKNPAKGKRPSNYRGDCPDGRGYLTRLVRGRRYFVHRIVFAEMIGIPIEQFPDWIDVHHIDEDRTNNDPDNLAATTKSGHRELHNRYVQSSEGRTLQGLSIANAIQYMTSRLP